APLIVTTIPTFRLFHGRNFRNNFFQSIGIRFYSASNGNIAQGSKTNLFCLDFFLFFQFQIFRNRNPRIASPYHLALVCQIKRRYFYVFAFYIVPNIHFGPIAYWERTEMFAFKMLSIEQIPKLRTLVFWIPLSKIIAVRKETFL